MFTFSLSTWYLFAAQLLDAVDFPISLPVGDLSTLIKGRSSRVGIEEGRECEEP